MKKILITGGCGFIGSNFIRYLFENYNYKIINLDALTYAGNPENLKDICSDKKYKFVYGRVEDSKLVRKIIKDVDYVVHFAAETHVDRSIAGASPFIKTNILGTYTLLESALNSKIEKFIYISTDEVYGSILKGKFKENSLLSPTSPYSASKASADLLAQSYCKTYNLPVIIVRPSNNYGPYQYPEKFIPLMITNALENIPLPIYGNGKNVRDWLYVEDNCRAIDLVLKKGRIGEVYNIGADNLRENIDVAKIILKLLGKKENLLKFVPDRPAHDFRYAVCSKKIREELGFKISISFEEGLKKTIDWYKENRNWWEKLKEKFKREKKGFWSK
jgi:dTDP-glucose 4,6-dehydratase